MAELILIVIIVWGLSLIQPQRLCQFGIHKKQCFVIFWSRYSNLTSGNLSLHVTPWFIQDLMISDFQQIFNLIATHVVDHWYHRPLCCRPESPCCRPSYNWPSCCWPVSPCCRPLYCWTSCWWPTPAGLSYKLLTCFRDSPVQ